MRVTVSKDKSTLVIEVPIHNPPKASSTGRTLLVATSAGNKETNVQINGQNLYVGVNAYIYATGKGTGAGASSTVGAGAGSGTGDGA
jgi:hypothetical protein